MRPSIVNVTSLVSRLARPMDMWFTVSIHHDVSGFDVTME